MEEIKFYEVDNMVILADCDAQGKAGIYIYREKTNQWEEIPLGSDFYRRMQDKIHFEGMSYSFAELRKIFPDIPKLT